MGPGDRHHRDYISGLSPKGERKNTLLPYNAVVSYIFDPLSLVITTISLHFQPVLQWKCLLWLFVCVYMHGLL